MVDFGESDKMIRINGKVDKSNTYNWFNGTISFFINRRILSRNITIKPVVSVWVFYFSTYVWFVNPFSW